MKKKDKKKLEKLEKRVADLEVLVAGLQVNAMSPLLLMNPLPEQPMDLTPTVTWNGTNKNGLDS